MSKTSIGIDIGLNSVKMVELMQERNGTVRIMKAAIRYASFEWDVFHERRSQELSSFIKRAREESKISKGKSVIISIPSISVFVRYIDILETRKKKESELITLEAQQQIPLSLDEVAWDYSVISKKGKSSKRAVLIAVKKDVVDESAEIVRKGGFISSAVTLNLLCLLDLVRHNRKYKSREGIVIVDIGAESTGILISRGRHIWLRSFALAGKKITESIAQNAALEFSEAESIKKEGPSALSSFDETVQQNLKETISFNIENLISEVDRSITFYKMDQMNADPTLTSEKFKNFQVLLTGGGSKIEGFTDFFEKKLGIQVECINTFDGIKVDKHVLRKSQLSGMNTEADIIDQINPLLSVAVGAALRGFQKTPSPINFLKRELQVQKSSHVIKYLRFIAYIFFFGAFLTHFVLQRQELQINRTRLHELEKLSENMDTYGPQLEKISKEIDVYQGHGIFLINYLQKRFLWIEILNSVSHKLLSDIWITSFQGNGFFMAGKDNELQIQGTTLSYDQLNDFITALKESEMIKEVKPESVVSQDDVFNFLLNLKVKNQTGVKE